MKTEHSILNAKNTITPEALAVGRDFRTDSTSNGNNIMVLGGEMTVAAGKSGIMAFCSFKIVWLKKKQ